MSETIDRLRGFWYLLKYQGWRLAQDDKLWADAVCSRARIEELEREVMRLELDLSVARSGGLFSRREELRREGYALALEEAAKAIENRDWQAEVHAASDKDWSVRGVAHYLSIDIAAAIRALIPSPQKHE